MERRGYGGNDRRRDEGLRINNIHNNRGTTRHGSKAEKGGDTRNRSSLCSSVNRSEQNPFILNKGQSNRNPFTQEQLPPEFEDDPGTDPDLMNAFMNMSEDQLDGFIGAIENQEAGDEAGDTEDEDQDEEYQHAPEQYPEDDYDHGELICEEEDGAQEGDTRGNPFENLSPQSARQDRTQRRFQNHDTIVNARHQSTGLRLRRRRPASECSSDDRLPQTQRRRTAGESSDNNIPGRSRDDTATGSGDNNLFRSSRNATAPSRSPRDVPMTTRSGLAKRFHNTLDLERVRRENEKLKAKRLQGSRLPGSLPRSLPAKARLIKGSDMGRSMFEPIAADKLAVENVSLKWMNPETKVPMPANKALKLSHFSQFRGKVQHKLLDNIEKHGWSEPYKIQKYAIPLALGVYERYDAPIMFSSGSYNSANSATNSIDLIGVASTGSGKTLAYLFPAVLQLLSRSDENAIVIVPTRELAVQIDDEFKKLAEGMNLPSVVCIGGIEKKKQIWYLEDEQSPIRMVVGCPGRLKDLASSSSRPQRTGLFASSAGVSKPPPLNLTNMNFLVLDEADRMLEDGFEEDILFLTDRMSPQRSTMLFSATWPTTVKRLLQRVAVQMKRVFLKVDRDRNQSSVPSIDSVPFAQSSNRRNQVGTTTSFSMQNSSISQNEASVNPHIQQTVYVFDNKDKPWEETLELKKELLKEVLGGILGFPIEEPASDDAVDSPRDFPEGVKILLFAGERDFCDTLCNDFWSIGLNAVDRIHGGRSQSQRETALRGFRDGDVKLLVATDVLSRGVDIPDISHVILFEFDIIENYVHRIGRTARGERSGKAIIFFEYWKKAIDNAERFIEYLEMANQFVPPELRKIADEVRSGERQGRKAPRDNSWN